MRWCDAIRILSDSGWLAAVAVGCDIHSRTHSTTCTYTHSSTHPEHAQSNNKSHQKCCPHGSCVTAAVFLFTLE